MITRMTPDIVSLFWCERGYEVVASLDCFGSIVSLAQVCTALNAPKKPSSSNLPLNAARFGGTSTGGVDSSFFAAWWFVAGSLLAEADSYENMRDGWVGHCNTRWSRFRNAVATLKISHAGRCILRMGKTLNTEIKPILSTQSFAHSQ